MPQRIPSPRELQVHTQSIMQNALIKKKLEEQRENFRKRQEMQQQQQQNPQNSIDSNQEFSAFNLNQRDPTSTVNNQNQIKSSNQQHIASPIPALAFTPTSVLRKMTAEKDLENTQLNSSTTKDGINKVSKKANE